MGLDNVQKAVIIGAIGIAIAVLLVVSLQYWVGTEQQLSAGPSLIDQVQNNAQMIMTSLFQGNY